jgi:hypothetical protein
MVAAPSVCPIRRFPLPRRQHGVTRTAEERTALAAIRRRGTASAFTQRRARVLRKTARPGPRLIALACTTPPAGCADWSLRRLAARAVARELVPASSHEPGRQTLKNTPASHGGPSAL